MKETINFPKCGHHPDFISERKVYKTSDPLYIPTRIPVKDGKLATPLTVLRCVVCEA